MIENGEFPKISIIIPTYNCAKYIDEAILSALNQTYSNKEIIIIDDGSKDNTKDILKKYEDNEKVKVVFQENQGVSKARNNGILIASGEYIATLDADDRWMPDRLDKMMSFLKGNPYEIVISNFYLVDEDRNRLKTSPAFSEDYTHPPKEKQYKVLLFEATAFALMIVKKEILIKLGGYDETLKGEAEDYDLWLRMLSNDIHWAFYAEPLVEMMVRTGSLSKGYSTNRKSALKKIFNKQSHKIGAPRAYLLYRYHLGGYRLDMLLVSLREKYLPKIVKHIFILFGSPFFSLAILSKKIFSLKGRT